jgi:hypothetical protein
MRTYAEQRVLLARMESARTETERHIAIIQRQIAARITTSTHVKDRQFGRAFTTWTRADERELQENVAALHFERRGEIDALARKLARQAGAIAAFRVRCRINPAPEELAS